MVESRSCVHDGAPDRHEIQRYGENWVGLTDQRNERE